MRSTDPNGLYEWDSKCKSGDDVCEENRTKFRDAYAKVVEAFSKAKEGTEEYDTLKGIIDKVGTEGDGNNVRVAFSSTQSDPGVTVPTVGGKIKMTFNFSLYEKPLLKAGWGTDDISFSLAGLVAHEGRHATEGVGAGVKWVFSRKQRLDFERRALGAESLLYKTVNKLEPFGPLWNPSWKAAESDGARRDAVEKMLQDLYGKKK